MIIILLCVLTLSTGPSPPHAPSQVSVVSVSHEDAEIEWRVAAISFTPETYHVEYGLSQQYLNLTTIITEGTFDVQATNLIYSSILTELRGYITYYYQVVAENTIGTSRSAVRNFTTSSPGK